MFYIQILEDYLYIGCQLLSSAGLNMKVLLEYKLFKFTCIPCLYLLKIKTCLILKSVSYILTLEEVPAFWSWNSFLRGIHFLMYKNIRTTIPGIAEWKKNSLFYHIKYFRITCFLPFFFVCVHSFYNWH